MTLQIRYPQNRLHVQGRSSPSTEGPDQGPELGQQAGAPGARPALGRPERAEGSELSGGTALGRRKGRESPGRPPAGGRPSPERQSPGVRAAGAAERHTHCSHILTVCQGMVLSVFSCQKHTENNRICFPIARTLPRASQHTWGLSASLSPICLQK